MPTISFFYGITIVMYPRGKDFPNRARKMVVSFILKYQNDLLEMRDTGIYKRLEPIK